MTDEGPFRVDMHVKVLDQDVVRRAKARGMDALVYAPHFTRLPEIRERAARFSDDDLAVIPAREIFTGDWRNRKHLLGIGLSEPIPDFITLEAAIDELRRQGAAVLVPHPAYLSVGLPREAVRRYRGAIDAVEVVNPRHLPAHDRNARDLVEDLDCPPFASSYAHLRPTVGLAWTEFDRELDDAADLVAALREGVSRRAVRSGGVRYERQRAAELGHLVYENTWKKVDRLFLSGTEPTHPRHIAYDGRFDGVSVY